MKKIFLILLLLFTTACGAANNQNGEIEPNLNDIVGTILDFFPFEENTTFVIASEDTPNLNQEIFTSHLSGNRVQQRIIAENLDITLVLEVGDGLLRQIYMFSDFPVFEDITDVSPNMDLVLLQEPLALGNYWNTGDMGGISTITNVNVPVETPVATFTETIQVTTVFPNGDSSVSYFAIGHGIVQDSYTTTFADVTSSFKTNLAEVRRGGLEVAIPVFFPDDQVMSLDTSILPITINTNQDMVTLFNYILPQFLEDLSITNVNSINVDREASLVHVDFSQSFLDISMGASYELLLLDSIANTFGFFYNVDNFRITLDGNNYESGHLLFTDSDYLPVGL